MDICKERAYETLKRLSFPRIAGTPEELAAAELIKAECDKAGVPAVIESFQINMPLIHEAKLTVNGPEACDIYCLGVGQSGNTPDEGLTGPLLYIENGMAANLIDAKGKILLLTSGINADVLARMRKSGALGYIMCHGSIYDPEEMVPEIRTKCEYREPGVLDNFPGVAIHMSNAAKLLRMKPESVTIHVKQDCWNKGTSHNVVATIEGTENPDEIIVFSAHFDSVIHGTGAWDNATGSITIMEIMHHFVKNPPKRTLKFVWCGSEEVGVRGSYEYCMAHEAEIEKYLFNINVDMTGVLIGYEKAVCSCDETVAKYIDFISRVEGYAIETAVDMYPSDCMEFNKVGIPAITFARLAPKGGAEIHSRKDNFSILDPDAFIRTIGFMVQFSEQVVNAKVFPVSRELPKIIIEKLGDPKKIAEDRKKAAEEEAKKAEEQKKAEEEAKNAEEQQTADAETPKDETKENNQ